MVIFRDFRFFQVFLVISTLMVSLAILPLNGYGNDTWVQAAKNENNIIYYNPSSVKIDKQKKIIDVSTKWVFTKKGKNNFSKNINDADNKKLLDISYSIIQYSFNYEKRKCTISNLAEYTKNNKQLYSDNLKHEWRSIPPNGIINTLMNKILQKYNIKNTAVRHAHWTAKVVGGLADEGQATPAVPNAPGA
jgi:ribosomal protein L20A (L18A)